MTVELEVLRRVSDGLKARGLQFMLTGSFAMAHYATPRMTRDIDLVVALSLEDVKSLVGEFSDDFYLDIDAARAAAECRRMFNMMHQSSGIKIDMIARKDSEYRRLEFDRRRRVSLGSIDTWIVSREDLILSKLVWASESRSEMQRRDVEQLLRGDDIDRTYLREWALRLQVLSVLDDLWH